MVALLAKLGSNSNSELLSNYISWCYLKDIALYTTTEYSMLFEQMQNHSTSAGQDVVTTHIDMDKRLGDTPTMR